MDVREGRPGKGEQADREDDAGDTAERQALLRSERVATVRDELADIALVVKDIRDDRLRGIRVSG